MAGIPLKTLAYGALTESIGVNPAEACQILGMDKHHSANLRARFEKYKISQSNRLGKLSKQVIENTAKIYVKETNKLLRGETVEVLTVRPADALRAAEIVQNRIDPLPKQGSSEAPQPIDIKAKYVQVNYNDSDKPLGIITSPPVNALTCEDAEDGNDVCDEALE